MFEMWAFLTRQKVVFLRDRDGGITKTVAKKTPFGYVAKRYWPSNVRNVLLLPDGNVYSNPYVIEWRDNTTTYNDKVSGATRGASWRRALTGMLCNTERAIWNTCY